MNSFTWIYAIAVLIALVLIVREGWYQWHNHPRRYGKGGVWPLSGRFVANRDGSTGMDPTGGMRTAHRGPRTVEVGHWSGHDTVYETKDSVSEYSMVDSSTIPKETTTSVGWWGDSVF